MDIDIKIALSAHYKGRGLTNAEIAALLRVDASSVSRYLTQAEKNNWLQQKVQLRLPKELNQAVQATVRALDLEDDLFSFFLKTTSNASMNYALRREGFVVVKAADDLSGTSLESRQQVGRSRVKRLDQVGNAMMGIEGARLLLDLLTGRDRDRPTVLGVTWGRSTGSVVSHLGEMALPEFPNLVVVALQGGVGRGRSSDVGSHYPDILAERLSLLFRSRRAPIGITLPAYIGEATASSVNELGLRAIWKFIENDASFQHAVLHHKRLDVALIGIGGFEPRAWALSSGYLPDASVAEALIAAGAIGDIACRFFRNRSESPIEGWEEGSTDTEVIRQTNLRAIGTTLASIRARIRAGARVLAIAGGHSGAKAAAIHAAVVGGFVTDVVTDARTALSILKLEK